MTEGITQCAREALEGVTPGPWLYRDIIENRHNVVSSIMWDIASCSDGGFAYGVEHIRDEYAASNAAFIAAARQLVPALIDEVEWLRAQLAEIHRIATTYTPSPDVVEDIAKLSKPEVPR